MQYGGNPQQQQQRLLMMMQARQQAAAAAAAAGQPQQASLYTPGFATAATMGGHHHAAHHAAAHAQQQHQQAIAEPTFVTTLTENDVLLGRGTPCAENEGNVRFRRLVKQRKVEYIAAEKRMRKDAIAREILEVIASRGGKFLRKVESQTELEQLGVPPGFHAKEVWAIVDEDTQVQKVKQALRNKDDAAELMANANKAAAAGANNANASEGQAASTSKSGSNKNKYGEHDVTNRFPRGVLDESNIHKADCNLQFGTGVLERASSHSSNEDKASGSPKLKSKTEKGGVVKSPGSVKSPKMMVGDTLNLPHPAGPRFDGLGAVDADLMATAGNRRTSMSSSLDPLTTPVNRRNLLAAGLDPTMAGLGAPAANQAPQTPGLSNMMRRQLWDKSQAAPSENDLRTLQELQRIRLMREQMGANPMMNPAALGLGPHAGLDAVGPFGAATSMADQQLMMNAEYRQMQQAQQMQQQMAAAAREQAAMAASLQRSSFSAAAGMGAGPTGLHPSLAARQLQLEAQSQLVPLPPTNLPPQEQALDVPPPQSPSITAATTATSTSTTAPPTTRPRTGADSAGERAIGIAQAMKRAEAFSPTESLEMSHLETLILSVLCSHGLPVWTPEAHTKSFVTLPTFAKRLDWTWYGFASVLKQKASSSHHNTKRAAAAAAAANANASSDNTTRVEELTLESAMEYQRDPRELATKTIMLMEKLRRHCDASTSSSQRKHSGLGMRVPLWLDRELSRWAMTLDIADPTGRPVPFSSTDFVTEHEEYKEDPAVIATAAFDPPLADDVVEQVALLTRLRSVFVKTKGRELRSKLEAATQRAQQGEGWEDQPKGWDVEPQGIRDLLLCDRLLSEGFSGVLTCITDLGTEYQLLGSSSPRRFPAFESVGLAKSSIQQRANQITRELHVMEEQKDLQRLRLDRMERLAQSVLSSHQPSPPGAAGVGGSGGGEARSEAGALNLLSSSGGGAPPPKKRRGSDSSRSRSRSSSPVDPSGASSKKQKTSKQ